MEARAKEMSVSTYVRTVIAEDIMNRTTSATPSPSFMDKKFNFPSKDKNE
jgi:hypothetical protein